MKSLKIVRFRDPEEESVYLDDAFFSELSGKELQEKVDEIVKKFESENRLDWDYEELIEEMYKKKIIWKIGFKIEWLEIIA